MNAFDNLKFPSETIPLSYRSIVHYDSEFKVLICVQCHFAFMQSSLVRHFRRAHGLKYDEYKPILDCIANLEMPDKHDNLLRVPDHLEPRLRLTVVHELRCMICFEF